MNRFAFAMIMADLFGVLMVTFLFSLGVVTPLINQEVTTYIESAKAKPKDEPNLSSYQEVARLNGIFINDNAFKFEFIYKNNDTKITLNQVDKIKDLLNKYQPKVLEVKIDGRIDSMILQKIILDTSELEIIMVQVNDAL